MPKGDNPREEDFSVTLSFGSDIDMLPDTLKRVDEPVDELKGWCVVGRVLVEIHRPKQWDLNREGG